MEGMAVELKGVAKRYRVSGGKDLVILNGIDLELEQGGKLALVGPSGAGKSTLLSLIAGLDRPTSGTVRIAGVDLTRARPGDLARIRFQHVGMVFQQYHLVPTLTALENVMLPCAPWKVSYQPRARAQELLTLVGLKDRMTHLPAQLSGGEQQRVCIARALINRPTVLLADEPTGNLDEESAGEVLRLIHDVAERFGMALLFVTHDMQLARSFGRMVRLHRGELHPVA